MNYPIFAEKYKLPSKIEQKDIVNLHRGFSLQDFKVPSGIILTYQRSVLKYAKKKYGGHTKRYFFGNLTPLEGRDVAIASGFGCGAPLSGMILEVLASLGTREFVSMGTAGGIQPHQKAGDIILGIRAIRDEGTSYHYLAPSEHSFPSKELVNKFEKVLRDGKIKYRKGTIWTTDAPYRETEEEINYYSANRVLAVDMETSALYAIARYRNVNLISALSISDILLNKKITYDEGNASKGLQNILDSAVHSLTKT